MQKNTVDRYPSTADIAIGNTCFDTHVGGLLGGSKAVRCRQNPVLGNDRPAAEASIDAERHLPGMILDVGFLASHDAAGVFTILIGPGGPCEPHQAEH